jgi:hypothetical protein
MTGDRGLCAAVYTQTTDCEVEVNGLMTYDRALVKADEAAITAANKTVYTPPAPRRSEGTKLVPPATPLVSCDPLAIRQLLLNLLLNALSFARTRITVATAPCRSMRTACVMPDPPFQPSDDAAHLSPRETGARGPQTEGAV